MTPEPGNPLANRRADFCRKTFRMRGFDIQWFNITGIVQLPNNRIAELHLSMAQHGTYKSIHVSIRHKITGNLGGLAFYFDDYLKTSDKFAPDWVIVDDLPSFPSARDLKPTPKFGWVKEPANISELMDPIEAYLKAWV